MLIKRELEQITVQKCPDLPTEVAHGFRKNSIYVAAVQVLNLAKSGKILVIDVFEEVSSDLRLRFFSDGVNFLLCKEWPAKSWLKKIPSNVLLNQYYFMYLSQVAWQVVYFAPVDSDGNPDKFIQFDAADTLKAALMDAMTLTSPEIKNEAGVVTRPSIVFHIIDVEGGPRDAEVYVTVRLEAEWTRPGETYDLMQDIQHLQRIGDIILN